MRKGGRREGERKAGKRRREEGRGKRGEGKREGRKSMFSKFCGCFCFGFAHFCSCVLLSLDVWLVLINMRHCLPKTRTHLSPLSALVFNPLPPN
jgi:hypothetical protein